MWLPEHDHSGSSVLINVVAHTHNAADATNAPSQVATVTAHNHGDALVYHMHDADTGDVNPVTLHTHAGNGRADVVYGHDHGIEPVSGVMQTEKHIHAVGHIGSSKGKYLVYVGPVPNGAGSVTISNTGTPRLAKHGADPYKDLYLATKGQNLGNVRLTFKAAGTMAKGAGIMIGVSDTNVFPQFYPDNPAGPAGGVRIAGLAFECIGAILCVPRR